MCLYVISHACVIKLFLYQNYLLSIMSVMWFAYEHQSAMCFPQCGEFGHRQYILAKGHHSCSENVPDMTRL